MRQHVVFGDPDAMMEDAGLTEVGRAKLCGGTFGATYWSCATICVRRRPDDFADGNVYDFLKRRRRLPHVFLRKS